MVRRESLREAVLEVERRWGVRASGRLFAGRYAPPLGLATGLLDLDRATGFGGIPRGKLSEITGSRSSGRLTLAMRALAAAVADGGLAAYIDLPIRPQPRQWRSICGGWSWCVRTISVERNVRR